jgi:hypothetical protein
MPKVRRLLAASENAHRRIQPRRTAPFPIFNTTSLRFLDRANLLVVTSEATLAWQEVPPALLQSKPKFAAPPPFYQGAGFIDSIRSEAAVHSRI